jgi:HK97 family phage portal protein
VIVRTFDGVQALTTPPPRWTGSSDGSLALYGHSQIYSNVYKRYPNIRIPIDFLMRNLAHLPPHVYRRVSDTDRVRLPDHQLAQWLKRPNPAMTCYRLMETLMGDIGLYMEAFWLKVRYRDAGRNAIGLVPLPPSEMGVDGGLLPSEFIWRPDGRERRFAPSEIVYFNGYNPCERLRGLSLLETLRSIVAEDAAAGQYREQLWSNAGRMEGIWELSDKAPKWTKEQQQDFREQWQEYAGGGGKAGMTAVGPRGATYKQASFSSKDSEYVLGGKLRREVSTAGWHIPQPMVGILDHATFSNIREQHKHLYQDTLGPTIEMITQELERQLLIECEDQRDVYVEFNIGAKLAGTFEERAAAIQMSVGRPWRTVNEARALENLPRLDDPEMDRVAPQQGGPSDATAQPSQPPNTEAPAPPDSDEEAAARDLAAPVIAAARARQRARLQKVSPDERASAFLADIDRWNRELVEDLTTVVSADEATRLALAANVEMLRSLDAVEATV